MNLELIELLKAQASFHWLRTFAQYAQSVKLKLWPYGHANTPNIDLDVSLRQLSRPFPRETNSLLCRVFLRLLQIAHLHLHLH